MSIRRYAEAHQLNRGSVDYLQKKFFSALAHLLKERDEAGGQVPSAETSAKLNRTNTERSVC